ncbi:cytochrome P450 94A1-like [Cucurbita pepo subsp. pepo]|uniref:cytochrome P450 94A1-like n=1 Tax=Cucurbita pepo subsp. pepo TaxID=3664 RepID=UPI000C9D97DE|nr:cytochrome P450 94A1-like [Cucurbita pepo subsp. pepo]
MEVCVGTILFITFFSVFFYLRKSRSHEGFRLYPVVGVLPLFLLNRHRFLDWTTEVLRNSRNNTAVFRRPGGITGVMTGNPDVVEHILKTQFENYSKGERLVSLMEDFLGSGIFNSDGEIWRIQRKMASYEFSTKSLRNFVTENVVIEIQTKLIPLLEKASETEQILDFQDVFERFAFDNVCKLSFNFDPGCLGGDATSATEFMLAFETAATLISGRFRYAIPKWYKIKKFFNLGSERTLKKSISIVHKFVDNIIRSRMEEKTTENKDDKDLLSRFMADKQNSPKFLRDIAISFILAGRDTTSSALTWFFWIISTRPDIKQKILKELKTIRSKTSNQIGETFHIDELRDMHYLQATLSETLRLYPPVPVDPKACRGDDVLPDGTVVGKNWFVMYHAYAMGRMESIWGKNCEEFWPERWLENGVCRGESPFRFPIFHAGPRTCVGKDMAYVQMKAIVAAVMERFEVIIMKKETPKHYHSLTLRMENGLQVMVEKRSI